MSVFWLVSMVFQGSFMVFHGFWLVPGWFSWFSKIRVLTQIWTNVANMLYKWTVPNYLPSICSITITFSRRCLNSESVLHASSTLFQVPGVLEGSVIGVPDERLGDATI